MGKAAVSQEEIQLRKRARRRLVGAVFLVLVMVIVLPLLLDSEPRPQAESVRVRMPTPQSEVADPPVPAAPKPAAIAPSVTPSVTPSATPSVTPPTADTAAPKRELHAPQAQPPGMADLPPPIDESAPAQRKPAAPAAAPPPAMQQASVQSSGPPETKKPPVSAEAQVEDALKPPVVIQLGAYLKPENAQQLKAELQARKIKAFTEPVTQGATTKTRVRAGPFASIGDAEKARDRIEKLNLKLGMAPKIVPQGQ